MTITFSKMAVPSPPESLSIIADLHIHSTASDGEYSPTEIAQMLNRGNIHFAALTDHDSFSGFREFEKTFDGIAIPGVELSVDYQNSGLHLLGYGFDPDYKPFIKLLEHFQQIRYERVEKMCDKLCEMGLHITMDNVKKNYPPTTTLGRPHVARAMLAAGYVKSFNSAFNKYIGDGKPAYIPKARLDLHHAIKMINDSGGITILAHPGLYHAEISFNELVKLPVNGFEAYHPNHSQSFSRIIIDYCNKHDLLYSGGSDFHDLRRNKANVIGKWGLNPGEWEQFKSYINANCVYQLK